VPQNLASPWRHGSCFAGTILTLAPRLLLCRNDLLEITAKYTNHTKRKVELRFLAAALDSPIGGQRHRAWLLYDLRLSSVILSCVSCVSRFNRIGAA